MVNSVFHLFEINKMCPRNSWVVVVFNLFFSYWLRFFEVVLPFLAKVVRFFLRLKLVTSTYISPKKLLKKFWKMLSNLPNAFSRRLCFVLEVFKFLYFPFPLFFPQKFKSKDCWVSWEVKKIWYWNLVNW